MNRHTRFLFLWIVGAVLANLVYLWISGSSEVFGTIIACSGTYVILSEFYFLCYLFMDVTQESKVNGVSDTTPASS